MFFADYSTKQNDPLCQNDELFPTVGKGIPFIDSLNANGAKKIWTEEKTATLVGSPPPSDGNKNCNNKAFEIVTSLGTPVDPQPVIKPT